MKNSTDDLKNIYDEIKVSDKLDEVVDNAILKGEVYMKNKNKKKIIRGIASTAAAVMIFTASVNIFPVFASKLENVPVLGTLVSVLKFNQGKAQGGQITDGADINGMVLKQGKDFDTILIGFNNENKNGITPNFNVEYKESPYTMTFTISGVRGFSAEKYFDDVKKSKYVKDIYKLMTLDDSAQRFNIVFNYPVKFEMNEYKNPASIKVSISKDNSKDYNNKVYSIRTNSYKYGESFSILEETLSDIKNLRVLKDKQGTFIYQIGNFKTIEEAEEKLKELKNSYGDQIKLFIEKRTANDIPEQIN